MFETQVTVVGNVATAVKARKVPSGDAVATFRIASTPRFRRGPEAEWTDGDSLFITVTCWRQLADNVVASIAVGDPVVVRGRIYTDRYEWGGQPRSEIKMEARAVGPDLSRCRARVARNRPDGADPATTGVGERSEGAPRVDDRGTVDEESAGVHPEGGRTVAVGVDGQLGAVGLPSDDEPDRLGAAVEAGVGS